MKIFSYRRLLPIFSIITMILLSSCSLFTRFSTTRQVPSKSRPHRVLRVLSPEEAERYSDDRLAIDSLMQHAVDDSVFPGAVLMVVQKALILHHQAYGSYGYGEFAKKLDREAIFDLASVTKVVATTSAAIVLAGDGRLNLDCRVGDYIPEFRQGNKALITIRYLLTHSSGLPPYVRYFLENLSPQEIVNRIFNEKLIYEPGTAYKYSDLGMIILGKIIEQISGTTLDRFCYQRIFHPLQMASTMFNPPANLLSKIPPTEVDDWRDRIVHGVVHDENAFALGGVAGHAGLFSNAEDLAVFLQMILNGGEYRNEKIFSLPVLRQFVQRQKIISKSTRALGWDTRSNKGSSSGDYLSQSAFGHTGFTGTSLWIDPEKGLFIILLSNRVHPTRKNREIIKFRPALHNMVMKKLIKVH